MASIVLTAAASAATSSLGLSSLGQIGSFAASQVKGFAKSLGNSIDNRIIGKSKRKHGQHRLELADLSVQTSTYAKMIPVVYGNARIAGNIIWSRPIKETVTTSTVSAGGKGAGLAPKQTQTSYSYSVTLAIAICEGVIDEVVRVWADSLPIDPNQGTYRLYKGTETQLTDPIIESFEGVGTTPAYRGLAYVVIEDFPLEAFGNRIPNFTFEVKKKALQADEDGDVLEHLIEGVNIIPGSGEFVYDTTVQYKIVGEQVGAGWVQKGARTRINQNNRSNKSDSLVGLDQLKEMLPNLEWVGLVVTWFGDSLDAATCVIKPGVEYQTGAITEPDIWSSGSFTRSTARQITLDVNGSPIYGGTPSDASILRYIEALDDMGYKIMFLPMFFMDISNKPWRGRVTGTTSAVANFFTKTNGYNAFITHYANLVKDKVDAFVIGSELIGLTKVYSGTTTRTYPAVDALVSLAATVRGIMGSSAVTKLAYAADWSEYHHTDDGWYNLDPLWASSNIDIVGIDAYFPITDKPQAGYDVQEVIDGWTKDEGYDWYYSDVQRTIQQSLSAPYAWKNIAWWWNNTHTNPNSVATAWVPQSKKIWFTEYGFPSIDGATNQPNVFYDPNSIESYFPYFSKGRIDFRAQRTGLMGTEKKWKNSSMIENKFIWAYDARPFPYFPDLTDVWADGYLWKYGHWINGKLGLSNLAAIVADICLKCGLEYSDFDVSRLNELVDGFILSEPLTGKTAIETLQIAYFFDAVESDGIIKFVPRGNVSVRGIGEEELVPLENKDRVELLRTRHLHELSLPQRVDVHFINRVADYQPGKQHAQKIITSSLDNMGISFPIVMDEGQAKRIADITLYNLWLERNIYQFRLSTTHIDLDPADVIEVTSNNITSKMRVLETSIDSKFIEVSAVSEDLNIYDFAAAPANPINQPEIIQDPGKTRLEFLDIPGLPQDPINSGVMRAAVSGYENAWHGAALYRSDDGGSSYNLMASVDSASTAGNASTILAAGTTQCYDRQNKVTVILTGGELESVSEIALLNGKNIALLGEELIQFKNATLLEPNKYELSFLLRGRMGTENKISTHLAGERFILLDESLIRLNIPTSLLGLSRKYKAVSYGTTLNAADVTENIYRGNCLKPFSPVRIKGARDGSGNITITWVRRTRINGDLRDYTDVPLNEAREAYEIEIMSGANVVRTITGLTSTQASYSAANQISDFASLQSSVTVKIYQLSDIMGRGTAGVATI